MQEFTFNEEVGTMAIVDFNLTISTENASADSTVVFGHYITINATSGETDLGDIIIPYGSVSLYNAGGTLTANSVTLYDENASFYDYSGAIKSAKDIDGNNLLTISDVSTNNDSIFVTATAIDGRELEYRLYDASAETFDRYNYIGSGSEGRFQATASGNYLVGAFSNNSNGGEVFLVSDTVKITITNLVLSEYAELTGSVDTLTLTGPNYTIWTNGFTAGTTIVNADGYLCICANGTTNLGDVIVNSGELEINVSSDDVSMTMNSAKVASDASFYNWVGESVDKVCDLDGNVILTVPVMETDSTTYISATATVGDGYTLNYVYNFYGDGWSSSGGVNDTGYFGSITNRVGSQVLACPHRSISYI